MTAPPTVPLPPWLQTNPLAGVGNFLQGFGQGASAAAQQASRQQQSAQFGQELAQRQAKAQQDYELTQQEQKAREAHNLAVALLNQQQLAATLRQQQEVARHNRAQERQAQTETLARLESPTALMRDLDFMGTLSEQAGKVMTPQERAEYLQTLGQGKLLGPKRTTRVNPDGTMEIIEGGADGGLTTAVKTELQKQSIQRQDPISIILDLRKNLTASDVGIRGVVGEFIDRGVAQVNPQAASKKRIESRHNMRQVQVDLYKSMRSDSNITDTEREKIEKMTPQLGMMESLPDALVVLEALQKRIIEAERNGSAALGKQPHKWAWTPKEIADAKTAGTITEREAVDAIIKYHPELLKQDAAR